MYDFSIFLCTIFKITKYDFLTHDFLNFLHADMTCIIRDTIIPIVCVRIINFYVVMTCIIRSTIISIVYVRIIYFYVASHDLYR